MAYNSYLSVVASEIMQLVLFSFSRQMQKSGKGDFEETETVSRVSMGSQGCMDTKAEETRSKVLRDYGQHIWRSLSQALI